MVALPIRKPELHNCKSLTSFFFPVFVMCTDWVLEKKKGGGGKEGSKAANTVGLEFQVHPATAFTLF